MPSYYSEKLSAERLKLCYDLAPPAVKRFLAAEIEYVREKSASSERVLELGCGYGRVLRGLSPAHTLLVGIDTSLQNLAMARGYLEGHGIVTKDGFTATTVTPEQFLDLTQGLGSSTSVRVVADSSVFCEILV